MSPKKGKVHVVLLDNLFTRSGGLWNTYYCEKLHKSTTKETKLCLHVEAALSKQADDVKLHFHTAITMTTT